MSTSRSTAATRRLQRLGHLRACACSGACTYRGGSTCSGARALRGGSACSGACACRGGSACSGACARRGGIACSGGCVCRGGSASSGACASRGGSAFKVLGIRAALDQARVFDLLRAKHSRGRFLACTRLGWLPWFCWQRSTGRVCWTSVEPSEAEVSYWYARIWELLI